MNVTPHFDTDEFASKDGTPYPAARVQTHLRPLCWEVLERIREEVDGPIEVISGYRTPARNRRVNGARASRHIEGDAADIRTKRLPAPKLHALILRMYAEGRLPLLGGLGRYVGFVHVDIRPTRHLVRWRGKRTVAQTVAT